MLLHSIKTQTEYFSCLSFAGNFLFWSCLCGKSPLHKVCYTLQQAGISPQQLLVSGGGGENGWKVGSGCDRMCSCCWEKSYKSYTVHTILYRIAYLFNFLLYDTYIILIWGFLNLCQRWTTTHWCVIYSVMVTLYCDVSIQYLLLMSERTQTSLSACVSLPSVSGAWYVLTWN